MHLTANASSEPEPRTAPADECAPAGAAEPTRGAAWTNRLNLLLESTGEGIFGIDNAGLCTFVNRAAYPILDDGRVQGAVVTLVDVTERKRGEALLRQAHEELERRVEERTVELSARLASCASCRPTSRPCARTNTAASRARFTMSWARCWWR